MSYVLHGQRLLACGSILMFFDSLVNLLNILPPDILRHLDIRRSVAGEATDMRKRVWDSVRVPFRGARRINHDGLGNLVGEERFGIFGHECTPPVEMYHGAGADTLYESVVSTELQGSNEELGWRQRSF